MSQSKIYDFYKSNNVTISKSNTSNTSNKSSKFKFIVKNKVDISNKLNIDISIGKQKISKIDEIIIDMYNNYKKIGKPITMIKLKKHFDIFEDENVLGLISLFEREIPFERKYYRRLVNEFYLIKEKGFFEVFTQVKQILNLTKQYPHIIRGSAGCSLVCYLMKITDLDPIKLNISLTRFMHENREDLPDVDIDFPAHDRNKIYETIFDVWKGRVARISNHVLFKEKSALKEAIRNNGYHKFLPKDFDLNKIFDNDSTKEKVLDEAKELLGSFRNYSLHCGGIIIFKNRVPKEYYLKDFDIHKNDKFNNITGPQIKLNKDEVEDKGLIKIDILSNKGLSQLWDISKKPILEYDFEDKNIYKYFSDGENLGLTYGESRGMRKIFVEMKPKNIHDIAIALALIRPAAAKNGQKFTFLKDYHFNNKIERDKYVIYDDDAIEHIGKLLKISNSDADIYRKAFAKNKHFKKMEFRKKLIEKNKRMNDEDIDLIMDRLSNLQSYSFCKSHAYSYAYLLYVLAYRKYYNPKEFWESTLKNCCTSYRKWTHYREAYCSGVDLKKYTKCSNTVKPEKAYFIQGFWNTDNFLDNMYLKFDGNILKKGNEEKKEVTVKFRGLIATYKIFKTCNVLKKKTKSKYITFVTIGYNNQKYIDAVLWGCHKLSKVHCIEGKGTYEDGHWIKVSNFNYSYI